MRPKFYVTGVAGLLGYNVYRQLKDRVDITGIDIVDIDDNELQYTHASLFDTEALKKELYAKRPDLLIHTMAMVNVDQCEQNPEKAFQTNAELTKNIADI